MGRHKAHTIFIQDQILAALYDGPRTTRAISDRVGKVVHYDSGVYTLGTDTVGQILGRLRDEAVVASRQIREGSSQLLWALAAAPTDMTVFETAYALDL
jgi:hypothetical protein